MERDKFKITIETFDGTLTFEAKDPSEYETCGEVLSRFAWMLQGLGWMPHSIYESMENIAAENLEYYNQDFSNRKHE